MEWYSFQKTVDLTETFMTVPNEWLGTLLPNLGPNTTLEPIRVLDERINKMYTFLLRKRPILIKDDQQLHLKPVFESQAWLEFVVENGLRSGDTLYFWKEGGRSDKNIISTGRRRSTKSLQVIWRHLSLLRPQYGRPHQGA